MVSAAPFSFRSISVIPTSMLTNADVGIQWELNATIEPPSQFQFFVERSGSPQGPWVIVSPALDAKTFVDTTVNRFSKHREIFYRVRAQDKETLSETSTTDPDSSPYVSNWDKDLTRGSVSGFESFVSGAISVRFTQEDLVRMELIRRNNMLLKRFVGVPTAALKTRTFGQPCEECFSIIEGRRTKSYCPACWGTTYRGGYFNQIDIMVNFDLEPKTARIEIRGEIEDIDDTAWMSNFPILSPRDILVRRDGRRWLVVAVQSTEIKRVPVRQLLALRLVTPSEKNVCKIPVSVPTVPVEEKFIGFSPRGGSGLL